MDGTESENTERFGANEAIYSVYGEGIHDGKAYKNKTHISFPEVLPSKTRELHLVKRDIRRLHDSKKSAENAKAQAESELFSARRSVKELTLGIEESNTNMRVQKQELQLLQIPGRGVDEWVMAGGEANIHQYKEVMRELDILKQELGRLKLDVASVLEAKAKAENETEASGFRVSSCLTSAEQLREEIEEANEEQVLVELARIEAVRDSGEIEAQREVEAAQFSEAIRETKERIKKMVKEISRTKELEMKLAITTSDLNVLQSEMTLVRAMEKNSENKYSVDKVEKRKEEELGSMLQLAEAELKAAKTELARIKEECFQFMASMDVVREELKEVSRETARLKKIEERADLTVQSLNSKLLRAKSKFEAASTAEEKSRAITSNLLAALQQLQSEMEMAKKEKELIAKETETIKMEIEKQNSDIDLAEERLQTAMQELEAVRASETVALDRLRALTERTMRTRDASSLHSPTITISNFEYEYLSRHGEEAQRVADKKVAAAQAWVEALKAGEKEISMKIEITQRELRKLRIVEEEELQGMEKSLAVKKRLDGELYNRKKKGSEAEASNLQLVVVPSRKSFKGNSIPASSQSAKTRRQSISHGTQQITRPTPSITLKRRKVIPNVVKFLRS